MEGWEEGRRGGGRAGALMPLEGEGKDRQLKMGGVPNPRQAVWVSLSPGWPWFKPQVQAGTNQAWGNAETPPQSGIQKGILPLGDTGDRQFLLPQGPPPLNPEQTPSPTGAEPPPLASTLHGVPAPFRNPSLKPGM